MLLYLKNKTIVNEITKTMKIIFIKTYMNTRKESSVIRSLMLLKKFFSNVFSARIQ